MSRLSYDSLIMNAQKFVRSCPDFRAFMSRVSCVRQTFVRSCSDFRAFMSRLSCVRQFFVRSCSDFRAFFDVSRLCNFERTTPPSCVHLRSGHTCFRLGPQPGQLLSAEPLGSDLTHQIFRWSSDQNAVVLLTLTRDNKCQ